jgi:hypothetical protein
LILEGGNRHATWLSIGSSGVRHAIPKHLGEPALEAGLVGVVDDALASRCVTLVSSPAETATDLAL